MSQGWRIWQLIGPFWKMKHLASFKAKLVVLFLVSIFKGVMSQTSDYTLTMPASVNVRQGFRAHVPCQFTFPHQTGSEGLYGYWFKKKALGYPLRSDPGHLVATTDKKVAVDPSAVSRFKFLGNLSQGNCSFRINDTKWGDEGEYYFRIEQGSLKYTYVTNRDKTYTSSSIFVFGPPRFIKILANVTSQGHAVFCSQKAQMDEHSVVAREGENIILVCKAESRPDPILTWRKGEKTLNGIKQDKKHILLLSEVRAEDAGEYQCTAKTPHGSARKILQLSVQYGPRLSNTGRNFTCWREDNSVLCTCSLHSWPPPQIKWQVDGEIINGSLPRETLQGNELTSTLNWTGSQKEDRSIVCSATNPSGTYTLQFVLSSSLANESLPPRSPPGFSVHATGASPSILVSALCGPLITALLFLLGACLIRLLKARKVSSRSNGQQRASDARSKGQQAAHDVSDIYSNLMLREGITYNHVLQDAVGRFSGIYYNQHAMEDVNYILPE